MVAGVVFLFIGDHRGEIRRSATLFSKALSGLRLWKQHGQCFCEFGLDVWVGNSLHLSILYLNSTTTPRTWLTFPSLGRVKVKKMRCAQDPCHSKPMPLRTPATQPLGFPPTRDPGGLRSTSDMAAQASRDIRRFVAVISAQGPF